MIRPDLVDAQVRLLDRLLFRKGAVLRNLERMIVQLQTKVQQSFVNDGRISCHVIESDLLGLWSFDLEHANDFTVGSNTVSAQVGSGTDQEDVFLLFASKRAVLDQSCLDKLYLCIN